MRRRDTRKAILDAAEPFFAQNQTPSVRQIANEAGVAIGMLTHHFRSYAGLVAALTDRLNNREAAALEKFEPPKRGSQLDIAVAFFRELAHLDLDADNARLRRVAGKFSWDWGAVEEAALAQSFMKLVDPLRRHLKFEKENNPDDILKALSVIYLDPLRLAAIGAILPPTKVKSVDSLVAAIVADITPKFALVLRTN